MSSKKSPAQRKLSSKSDPKKLNGNYKGEKVERCRGRCRVQWSEKHVKEGLVLVQETQLARVWAKVYRCRSRSTGTLYAAKYSSRTRFNTDCSAELRHEIALLSLCSQSPRVVRLHDVYETPKEIILVMEYAPGGDLQTLIDGDLVPLEGDVVNFVKQLVEGLAYLHERNIAHLDIKVRHTPEILHYEPITLAADMWSLGVTTYVLLTGFSPFGGETDQETFQNISLGEVDFPEELFEDVSTQAKDFVAKLLVLDPSARMSAKQCLRHDWLRAAPTQASPHLRRYLSKSREVLLERVVSRENLRRVALMNQQHPSTLTSSQANLSDQQGQLADGLSQSEMCLHMTTSVNLINSQCYNHPASGDSQTSLDSSLSLATSQTSLNSQASLATSQNYLLNAEQTLGLLNQVQSRSQANLNHANRRGLLSRMRSLNQIQSQACLTTRSPHQKEFMINPLFGSRSREKLYGLKCLSKSQGVLNIYHSLESIRKITKKDNSKNTPKYLNSRFSSRALERCESAGNVLTSCDQNFETKDENPRVISSESEPTNQESKEEKKLDESEENLDSLQSVESDTLTEDSDEIDQRIKQSVRQNSDISSHSNNSGNSDDKHFDEPSESENDEPKYTVAQLVSAFNKHQEVASKSSLEAIMTEKRVNEVNFPTGPKALRLFIPDINIQERGIVRRKTSYKPRKNWEELRKRNEKNEGLIKDLDNDSGNEDEDDLVSDRGKHAEGENKSEWTELFEEGIEERFERNVVINEKYKQCVNVANSNMLSKENEFIGDGGKEERKSFSREDMIKVSHKEDDGKSFDKGGIIKSRSKKEIIKSSNKEETNKFFNKEETKVNENKYQNSRLSYLKERMPNYIHTEVLVCPKDEEEKKKVKRDSSVNLKDILKMDGNKEAQKNIEKLRKRTSITKIIVTDEFNKSCDEDKTKLRLEKDKGEEKEKKIGEEKKIWGKVCTGSYTRAMEKFNGKKNIAENLKSKRKK
ncbi:hypothetical protein G9C98_001745 [Cotesia typhae]|uniref:Protein kinase domain-containing protein n=1 Tax=Cotesia typhae TaxID=2053667 RepID=A0A8J5QM12_9HYME|nr:hypothetical protein G9C98_001745 [Cotesia typhae]